VIESLTNSMG